MSKVQDLAHAIDNGRRYRSGELLVTTNGDVFSYDTCIFRCSTRQLHVKNYGVTTTRHQNLVRAALTFNGMKFSETEDSIGVLALQE